MREYKYSLKEEEENRNQMELEGQKRKEQGEKNKINAKKYFIFSKNRETEKKEYKYTYEYIIQFKNWKISKEDELLTNSVKQHFKNFEDKETEGVKRKKNDGKIHIKRNLAEEYKQKIEETINNDPIKGKIRGFLNMLTKENYTQIKQDIFYIIRDNVDYQIKFLDIIFKKAVLERAYVSLYAKLLKEFDKELPQKLAPKEIKKNQKLFQL